jgi:hypothetical protein
MTSLDLLFEKLWDLPKDKFSWHSVLEQAKQMHKKEIITAYNEGDTFPQSYYNGKHYYELTFKKD